MSLTLGSLFSGIGGLDLAAQWAGFETAWFVEKEPFCQRVLAKHWPGVPIYDDVFTCHDLPHVDVIAGGFPCQPFSMAGKRQGAEDERYLLPEMLRIIQEVKPYAVLFENVPGFPSLTHGAEFKYLLRSLAEMGFDAEWGHLRASDAGAPHQRERWFCVAYRTNTRINWWKRQQGNDAIDSKQWDGQGRSRANGGNVVNVADTQSAKHKRRGAARRRRAGLANRSKQLGNAGSTGLAQRESIRSNNEPECKAAERTNRRYTNRPTQSRLGRATSRFSNRMDTNRRRRRELVFQPHLLYTSHGNGLSHGRTTNATSKNKRPCKALRGMRKTAYPKDHERKVRRPGGIYPAEILQRNLFGHRASEKIPNTLVNIPLEGKEVQEVRLRSLRRNPIASRPSYRPRLKQQRYFQPANTMPMVSRFLAQHGETTREVSSRENAKSLLDFPGFPARPTEPQYAYEPPRVTTGKQANRAARLKALGNAVVPQVVYPLFLAIRDWLQAQTEDIAA